MVIANPTETHSILNGYVQVNRKDEIYKMNQQTMQRDYILETKIAKQVYGRETEWLDTGAGLLLYMMSDEAADENDSLFEGRMENGELTQRNGRLCPAWSTNMLDVWELVQYCAIYAQSEFRLINRLLLAHANSTPNQIAESIVTKAVA